MTVQAIEAIYARGENAQKNRFDESAITSYEKAIQKAQRIRTILQHSFWLCWQRGSPDSLRVTLRNAYCNLAIIEGKQEEWTKSLHHFEVANEMGKIEVGPIIEDIRLGITEISKQQQKLLSSSKKHDSRSVVKVLWEKVFQKGVAVSIGSSLNRLSPLPFPLVKEVSLALVKANGSREIYEYLIRDQYDLALLKNELLAKDNSLSQALLDYITSHDLGSNPFQVHYIMGIFYRTPFEETFSKGHLDEEKLTFLYENGFQIFTAKWGTHFIGGYTRGNFLLTDFVFKFRNLEERENLCMDLPNQMREFLKPNGVRMYFWQQNSFSSSFLPNIPLPLPYTQSLWRMIAPLANRFPPLSALAEVHFKTLNSSITIQGQSLQDIHFLYNDLTRQVCSEDTSTYVEAICEPWTSLVEVRSYLAESKTESKTLESLQREGVHSENQADSDEHFVSSSLEQIQKKLTALSERPGQPFNWFDEPTQTSRDESEKTQATHVHVTEV